MSALAKAAKGAVTGFIAGGPFGALAGAGAGLASSLLSKKKGQVTSAPGPADQGQNNPELPVYKQTQVENKVEVGGQRDNMVGQSAGKLLKQSPTDQLFGFDTASRLLTSRRAVK